MPGSASSEPHKGQPYPCTMRDSLVEWRGCGEFDTKPAGRQISIKSDIYMDVFEYKSYIYIQDIVPPFSISPFSSTSFFYLFPSSGRFVCPETRKSDSAQSIFFPQARLLIDFFSHASPINVHSRGSFCRKTLIVTLLRTFFFQLLLITPREIIASNTKNNAAPTE